jgi:protein SCO1
MRPLALAAGCFLLVSGAADARIDAGAFDALSFRQHPGAQLPLDAALTDETGRPVHLSAALRTRPALVVLEYLRCRNLCSLVLRGAVHSLQVAGLKPGRDVDLVAISIDPRDTTADAAAARKMYVASFADPSAASGMHFLTGSPGEVARIASAVGFPYRFDKASGQYAHPAGFVVTTPSGKISRYILGIGPPPPALRQAVSEAGAGDVEPAAHPLLLLCFGYDPDEGTVAALAMRLVRWVSFAAIIGAVLLIAFLSLRRRPA